MAHKRDGRFQACRITDPALPEYRSSAVLETATGTVFGVHIMWDQVVVTECKRIREHEFQAFVDEHVVDELEGRRGKFECREDLTGSEVNAFILPPGISPEHLPVVRAQLDAKISKCLDDMQRRSAGLPYE